MYPGVTGHVAIVPGPSSDEPVYRRATATSSQRYVIPTNWHNRLVRIAAHGEDVQILFGSSTVSVTLNQASSLSTETLTANAASGFTLKDGVPQDFYIKSGWTHFAIIGSSTGSFWEAYRAQV